MLIKTIEQAFKDKKFILLRINEHHGHSYKLIKTQKSFYDFFASLLKERDYLYNDSAIKSIDRPEPPNIPLDSVAKFPENSKDRAFVENRWEEYNKQLLYYNRHLNKIDLIKKAIKENNGVYAYKILFTDQYNRYSDDDSIEITVLEEI